MSNWNNFNLDAPEFVPKFTVPSPQQQQQQSPAGGSQPRPGQPFSPPQYQPQGQQPFLAQQPGQHFYNPNQPFVVPPQVYQQQPAQPIPQVPQAAQNQVPAPSTPQQPTAAAKSHPASPSQAPAPTPKELNELTAELSSLSTKVEPIKEKEEEEEWEKKTTESGNPDEEIVADEEEIGTAEVAAKPKKQIVIREYKAKKEPVNIIFCGHVDAGKSTIGGQIMYLTGMVDKRTLEKYEREAREKNRESWYLSWALDTNLEEREKGKTVEVGRAYFETEKKHFIILDAPGHRGFVPNMIGGASQADIAVLVISARKGEFETGFERGGQTREHAMLVKTAGVKYLVVLVNKMDDPTVNWDQGRYEEIKEKLTPYLKKCGFTIAKDTYFMPCSGYTGAFIKDPVDETVCPWFRGPCFIEYVDSLPQMNRSVNGAVRMPLVDKYKDMGTVVMGKIESGMIRLNDKLCVMPNRVKVEVVNIYCEEDETDSAICGENVKLKLKGIEEEEISSGFVLCDLKDTCQFAKVFDAQVVILDYPSIICPGFNSIMHIHAATAEVQLTLIIGTVDKKTGEKDLKNRPRFIKQDQIAICRFEVQGGNVVCMEPFKLFPQLGRFTLRYENKTVAVGKVLKIIDPAPQQQQQQ